MITQKNIKKILEGYDKSNLTIGTLGGQPCTRTYNDDDTYDLTWKYVHGNMLGAKGSWHW